MLAYDQCYWLCHTMLCPEWLASSFRSTCHNPQFGKYCICEWVLSIEPDMPYSFVFLCSMWYCSYDYLMLAARNYMSQYLHGWYVEDSALRTRLNIMVHSICWGFLSEQFEWHLNIMFNILSLWLFLLHQSTKNTNCSFLYIIVEASDNHELQMFQLWLIHFNIYEYASLNLQAVFNGQKKSQLYSAALFWRKVGPCWGRGSSTSCKLVFAACPWCLT